MTDKPAALSVLFERMKAQFETIHDISQGAPNGLDGFTQEEAQKMHHALCEIYAFAEAGAEIAYDENNHFNLTASPSAGVDVSPTLDVETPCGKAVSFECPHCQCRSFHDLPDAQGWLTIESAPRDGTVIRVKIDGMSFLAKWKDGFIDENEKECGGWTAHEEGLHPPCWTDGDCWASNDQGDCSAHPTHWMPQPAKDKSK